VAELSHLRVLLIEDDALIVLMLRELLLEIGHEVCATAASEAAAVEAALRDAPDLVIADSRLQSGSGISAVAEIIRRRGHIPHLFLTGDDAEILRQRPAAIVLRKPFRQSALVKAIQSALDAPAGS